MCVGKLVEVECKKLRRIGRFAFKILLISIGRKLVKIVEKCCW